MFQQRLFSLACRGTRLSLSTTTTLRTSTKPLPTRSGLVCGDRWLSTYDADNGDNTAAAERSNSGKDSTGSRPSTAYKKNEDSEQELDALDAFIKKRQQSNRNRQHGRNQQTRNKKGSSGFQRNRNLNKDEDNNRRPTGRDGNRHSDQRYSRNHQRRTDSNHQGANTNWQNKKQRKGQQNQGFKAAEKTDPRLKGLIEQLRKHGGKGGQRTSPEMSPATNRSPSWRQRFAQPRREAGDQSNRQEDQPLPPSFLSRFAGRDRNSQRPDMQRPGQKDRVDKRPQERDNLEFLEGRKSRSDSEITAMDQNDEISRIVTLPGVGTSLTLAETSALFRIKVEDIETQLRSMGISSDVNEELTLDSDTLELLAIENGIETIRGEDAVTVDSQELLMQQRRANEDGMMPTRPPVVCIMGHVDHGKTTLMDALRRRALEQQNPSATKKKGKKKKKKASQSISKDVAGTEAGGITQIISAFQVDVEGQDNRITFLDTPGHAAFKSMRQSGSHAADVIVLVIAADDGVSEQTVEILNFYKSIVKDSNGGISMVVALNKIDKPGIDVEEAQLRIENQLLEHGILSENMNGSSEYGTPVQVIPTSGLTGLGLDDLMEGLVLQSEVMDLRADDKAHAEGIVMDARLEKGLGVVADCIIRWGSMEKGDMIVSGTQSSRIRMLKDVNDKMLKRGLPSQPVRIIGFKSLPKAGDPIMCVESEDIAEEMVEQRKALEVEESERPSAAKSDVELHINDMRSRDSARAARVHALAGIEGDDGTIRIPIIVKADADGSLSAVRESLVGLAETSSCKVTIDPIQDGIGDITPTDIQMAKESDACIFAFGLKRIDPLMLNMAETEGVTIRSNDIIYALLDDAKETLGRYLPPVPVPHVHGRAEVQAIFTVDTELGKEKIAGLRVLEGNLYKSKGPVDTNELQSHFRVFRDGEVISPEGESVTASSLRHFKDLVDSVRHGEECGLGLSGFDDFQEGDEIECYSVEMKAGSL